MNNTLSNLTQAAIRARCTEASFERGQRYYAEGSVSQRLRQSENRLAAWVSGTEDYHVTVELTATGELATDCTCPYAYGGDCKHIAATLLAWLAEPASFQPPVDWPSILNNRRKSELVELLLKAIAIYPDLEIDLNLKQQAISLANPERVVADVFEAMALYGRLTAKQAAARLDQIAQQADQLAKQGQAELARRTYYEIVVNCVRLFSPYGHELIAPYEIPYKFAVAYVALAEQQVGRHRATIEAEVREMHNSDYIDELFDLLEALFDIEVALGWVELDDDEDDE